MNTTTKRSKSFGTGVLLLTAFVAISAVNLTASSAEPKQPVVDPVLAAFWRTVFERPIQRLTNDSAIMAKQELGRRLFFDKRLSRDQQRNCATCHQPAKAFTDQRKTALGRNGRALHRNTPTLYNLAWGKAFYWDGRAPTLAAQARFPIEHPNEMGIPLKQVVARLRADSGMVASFKRAFALRTKTERHQITSDRILEALATYEKSLIAPRTRFDAWVDGNDNALTTSEQIGFALFVGKAGCVTCHTGWRFTDDEFHDIGLSSKDPGRGAVRGGVPGLPAFKTPGLRELTRTAPYMHDGSLSTLSAVVDHYAGGMIQRPSLSSNIVAGLQLTSAERQSLVAYLRTLSSAP